MLRTSQQYDQVTRLQSKGISVVRCTADWCGPCKVIAPQYNALVVPGVNFYTIDVEAVEDFQDIDAAKKLPCFFIFKAGRPQGLVVGANIDALLREVQKLNIE